MKNSQSAGMHHLFEEKDKANTEIKKVGRKLKNFFTGLSFNDVDCTFCKSTSSHALLLIKSLPYSLPYLSFVSTFHPALPSTFPYLSSCPIFFSPLPSVLPYSCLTFHLSLPSVLPYLRLISVPDRGVRGQLARLTRVMKEVSNPKLCNAVHLADVLFLPVMYFWSVL
jgi:hypothetical protein